MERRMSPFRLGAAAVLVAIAVLAALLATDLRGWQHAVAQGDAVYAVAPLRAAWTPPTALGGAAAHLLGTSDELAWRRALQLYVRAQRVPNRLDTAVELQTLRSRAEQALARAGRGRHASQAETLLGVLAFDQTDGADAATANFTDAVRADTSNVAAKFDLELVLRLTTAQGTRSGSGPRGAFGPGGRRGAGGGVPGSGY
jgi:hypothetical protein